jgi:hypothetical protein
MGSLAGWAWYSLAGLVVLILPGAAWLAWCPAPETDLPGWLAEAAGFSLALTALAGLAGFLVGWRFTWTSVAALYALAAALLIAGLAWRKGWGWPILLPGRSVVQRELDVAEASWRPAKARWAAQGLVLAAWIAVLAWRFYQARLLVLPAWVDSLHHVLIVRLILEQGGIPHTFAPYLPVPFFYHFGFHAAAASFAQWSGLQPPQAVLWFGQVLNALVALAVYRLGLALWGDWRPAGLAGLLVGFVTQMPAYYLSWGRYTLLAGLVLLPLALAEALEMARSGGSVWRAARLAILSGGLLLTHYFAALLWCLFLPALGVQLLGGQERAPAEGRMIVRFVSRCWKGIRQARLGWLVIGAGAGALLAGAWLISIWPLAGSMVGWQAATAGTGSGAAFSPDYLDYLWRMLGPQRSHLLLGLALPGLVVAGVRRQTRALMVWAELLALLSLPWSVQLRPFRADHVVIVLFLPVALLAADFLVYSAERLGALRWARRWFSCSLGWAGLGLVGLATGGLLVWGLMDTRDIVNATTILASQADRQALEWVAAHTPAEARFFINVTHWQGATYRGVDGGWWILPATGRGTLLPPVLYTWSGKEFAREINALAEKASQLTTCSQEFWEVARAAHLTHVYLEERRGSLQPAGLVNCASIRLVYAEQGVSIYAILE